MSRIYLTIPDDRTVIDVVEELKQLDIDEEHIHVIAKDASIARKAHIHKASEFYTTDAWHMGIQGLAVGALLGAGIFLLTGMAFEPITFLRIILLCAALGGLACMLIGVGRNESHVEEHAGDIEKGAVMLLVDTPKRRENKTVKRIFDEHPEIVIERSGVFLS